MSSASVQVVGLREFSRALRRLDADLPKALRIALNGVADFVINEARKDIPRRTGAAAASLKAQSSRTQVRVRVGGKKAPYYPWLDFGGKTGPNKSVERPFYKDGRYLYPTLRKHRDEFTDRLRNALVAIADGAGLEVD